MTKPSLSRSIRRLPVTDRIELLDELWHSIAADQQDIPVPRWQKQMIDESLQEIERHPGEGMTHAQFKAHLRTVARQLKSRHRKSA